MDSITHIALGAIIGDALARKKLGKSAMLWGAIAQSLPDIDFVASAWLDTSHDVLAHRGITHSFVFVGVMAFVLAGIAGRMHRERGTRGMTGALRRMGATAASGMPGTIGTPEVSKATPRMSMKDWLVFFGLELFVHIFLDAFNAYGTGWFEPFSHHRVAFHVLFVADPFYSIWLGIAFLALLILRRNSPARKYWVWFGLILSSCYLCYCVLNKVRIDRRVEGELQRQGIAYRRYFTTPTPLNSWLWYTVAEDGDGFGFYTAYLSVFDRSPVADFHFFPRNDSLLAPFRHQEDVHPLLRFSQGYYTIDRWDDTLLVFNDLRFGQVRGWEDGQARFVFHYFLQHPADNAVIVQRGRLAGWNRRTIRSFIRRIRGD